MDKPAWAKDNPDVFYCEKFYCWMFMDRCRDRQEIKSSRGWGSAGLMPIFEQCQNCKQGEKIMEERATYGKLTEKECKRCKKIKAITEYQRNHKAKDGHLDTCKACMYELRTEGIGKKWKERLKTEANEGPSLGIQDPYPSKWVRMMEHDKDSSATFKPGKTPVELNNVSIVVDFKDYPEIYDQLKDLAHQEIRSIEQQALFYVISGLKIS